VLIGGDREEGVQFLCHLFGSESGLFGVAAVADGIEALIEVVRQKPDLDHLDTSHE